MRTFLCVAAIVASSGVFQDRPTDDKQIVLVNGCVEKSWLKVISVDPIGFHVDKFKLRGSKDVMSVLTKELNGHHVELTGALYDPGKTMGSGKTKNLGKKTQLYVRERQRTDLPPIVDPSLDVISFRTVRKTCK